MDSEALLKAANVDMKKLNRIQPIYLILTGPVALCLLGQLQLALRHPGNTGRSANIVGQIARDLQRDLSITPALTQLCEAGWNPDNDQPTTPDPAN